MKKIAFGILAIGMAGAISARANLNLVNDGGFEQGTAGGSFTTYGVGAMGGWTVTAGNVDLVGGYWQPAAGSQSVDMAGFYANGTIQQTINNLTSGSWYYLTFDMSGNPDGLPVIKTLDVTFGNTSSVFTFDTTGISHANMNWSLRSGWFQANGISDDLIFTDASDPGTAFGAVIDNVSLVAVPEPTTVMAGALLLLPLGLSTVRILRKHRMA
jgi:choice-of-anchor C domain-containing protein